MLFIVINQSAFAAILIFYYLFLITNFIQTMYIYAYACVTI